MYVKLCQFSILCMDVYPPVITPVSIIVYIYNIFLYVLL